MRVRMMLGCVLAVLIIAGGLLAGCKGGKVSDDAGALEKSRKDSLNQQDEMKAIGGKMKSQGATKKGQ